MKQLKKYNLGSLVVTLLLSLFVLGCSDENPVDPTADFSYEVDTQNTLLVSFEAIATNGITLSWNFGDGTYSIAKNAEHEFPSGGEYTVKLEIYGEEGSRPAVIEKTITLIENPTANFSYETDMLTVSFTSTTTAAVSFAWDFGDGESSTEVNPVHTYGDYGDYTVTLTVTGQEGSVPATVTKTVKVVEAVFEAVVVGNADFSLPGTGKKTNWTDVPGWKSDSQASDSGVEANGWWDSAPDNYRGYKKSSDPATYNLTNHVITAGEEFKLNLIGFDIWNGPHLYVTLYYDTGDGIRHIILTQNFDLVPSTWNSVELLATASTESVGAKLGIEIESASGDGGDGWTGFDNIVLMAR